MYGGYDGSNKFNHLFIVELGRHSVVSVITSVCVCVCVCVCVRVCVRVISLFLSPALEQHQYINWSLSRMASGESQSCCHSLVWFIVCDCGRI